MASKKLDPEAGKLTNPRVAPAEANPAHAGDDYQVDQRHPHDQDGNAEQVKKPRTGSAALPQRRKKTRSNDRRTARRAW